MKFLKALLLLVCIILLSCLVGCSKTDNRLVGKWKNQSLPEIVEFRADKTGNFVVKERPPLAFTWQIVSEDNVRIDISYQGQIQSLSGTLEKNTFVLSGKGEQAVYVKME